MSPVTLAGGNTIGYAICHDALKDPGPLPGIAGCPPGYAVRRELSRDDMLAIAAYTASRTP